MRLIWIAGYSAIAALAFAACGGGSNVTSPAVPGGAPPVAVTSSPHASAAPAASSAPNAPPTNLPPSPGATSVPSSAALPANTARTTSGTYSGTDAGGVTVFKGIPYAQPPVGALRWKPPQPIVSPLPGIVAATNFGLACEQAPGANETVSGPMNQSAESEDCLYLNVYAPSGLSGRKPVDLWIYGGSFTGGYADPYAGTPYAQKGVVFVSFDYRLGIFGYFSHPGLDGESPQHISGNQGAYDQLAALQWVRDNIASFGGDPNNITIHGESAGSIAVAGLMVSPLASGLFKHAIEESGAGWDNTDTLAQQEQAYNAAFPGFYTQSIASLRALPATSLVAEEEMAPSTVGGAGTSLDPYATSLFAPIVDGRLLPMDDRHMWLSGRFNPADLLVGNCENEGYLFTMSDVQLETYPTFESNLSAVYGSLTPQAMAAYPVSAPGATGFNASDAMYQLGHFLGDPILVYGSRQTARTLSQVNRNVFRYAFTRPAPGQNGPDTHICEIPFVFPGLYPVTAQQVVPDPGAATYAATIVDAWSQFMKTGNPNGGQIHNWPAYDATDPDLNFTAAGPIPETGFRQQGLDAVDAYHRLHNP